MKGSGRRNERETIINFNDGSDNVSLWTSSEVVYRRLLKRLGRGHLRSDGQRSAEFEFPKKYLTLPRFKKPVTHGFHTNPRQNRRKTIQNVGSWPEHQLDE